MYEKALLTLLLTFVLHTVAPAQSKEFVPKGSFGFDMTVPTRAQNPALQRIMQGLYNGGVDYQYNFFKGIKAGVGLKYSFFTLNSFAFNNADISGSYHMPGAYVRLGYEKFTNDRVSLSASVRSGYSFLLSVNDSCRAVNGGPHVEQSLFVEPEVEILVLLDEVSPHAFSFVVSYSIYFDEFEVKELCMQDVPNVLPEDFSGITRFLSIGFGYRYYFGRN
jgi:hypothetical protein